MLLSASPASAGFDEGKSMISEAITELPEKIADMMLAGNYFESEGNLSETEPENPSEKMVNNIERSETDPRNKEWVMKEQEEDYITYVEVGLIILFWVAGFFFLQKIWPDKAAEVTEFFSGAKHFIGMRLFVQTLALLILLPTFLPYLLDASMDIEYGMSDGIEKDSTGYYEASSENSILYFYQAVNYMFTSTFFTGRADFIDNVYAKVLFVALLLAIPWKFLRYLGIGTLLYFETVLFLRPVCLWINEATMHKLASIPLDKVGEVFQAAIGVSANLTFLVIVGLLLWPAFYILYLLYTSRRAKIIVNATRR